MNAPTQYKIVWSHNHASGVLPLTFPTRDEAEEAAREWLQDMVNADDDPEDAAQDYDWEVIPHELDPSPKGL